MLKFITHHRQLSVADETCWNDKPWYLLKPRQVARLCPAVMH